MAKTKEQSYRAASLASLEVGEFTFRFYSNQQNVGSYMNKVAKTMPGRKYTSAKMFLTSLEGKTQVCFKITRIA